MDIHGMNEMCVGCLSVDRKVDILFDVECKQMYGELLNSMDQLNQELLLCWECKARLRSIVKFKQRVRTAHDTLMQYMFQQTHISSLSSLITSYNWNYQCSSDDKSLVNIIPSSNDTNEYATSDVIHYSTPHDRKLSEVKNINIDNGLKTQPVFVKIEDNDLDLDGHFYEENVDHSVDEKDDYDTVALKPVQEVSSKRSKSKKKKRTKEEFDESDDEPLRPKKAKRGRPKKEEKGVERNRGKREKPAGVVSNSRVHRNLEQLNVADGQLEMVVLSWEEKPAGVVSNSRVHRNLEQLNVADGQLEMFVLSWEEVEAERQQARESTAFTRHAHRCEDCVLGFNHRVKLDAHMDKHKPEAGASECPVCRVRCRDDHALVAHKRRHRVRWRCVSCGAVSSRAAVAADHAARAHGAAPTHTCRRCGDTLTSLAKLRNHMKNHAERQKCELCGKTFRDRTSLRTHLFIHRGEKEYSCPHCEKRFLFKKAMEVHLVTHAAPAQLYCLECDMTFKNRMSYYQHKKYNLKHVDPAMLKHQCPLCDKKFLKAARLQEHNFAVHLKVTPIRCSVQDCDFACSSRPVLRTHLRMVHRNARAARNHVCHTCGKAYTTKKTLEGHMRSHTGERPFHCSLCPSTFSYEAALYNHNRLVHLKPKMDRATTNIPNS